MTICKPGCINIKFSDIIASNDGKSLKFVYRLTGIAAALSSLLVVVRCYWSTHHHRRVHPNATSLNQRVACHFSAS